MLLGCLGRVSYSTRLAWLYHRALFPLNESIGTILKQKILLNAEDALSLASKFKLRCLFNAFERIVVVNAECTPQPPLNGALLPWGEFHSGLGTLEL